MDDGVLQAEWDENTASSSPSGLLNRLVPGVTARVGAKQGVIQCTC